MAENPVDQNSLPVNAESESSDPKADQARMLLQVVCICKGINLGKVLKAMDGCETVADVNRKAGTGNGGCMGERCGPRIKILLRKMKQSKSK